MGEIDELHHPDDEHEAECYQREQQAEAQAVQEMGDDVGHGDAVPDSSVPEASMRLRHRGRAGSRAGRPRQRGRPAHSNNPGLWPSAGATPALT